MLKVLPAKGESVPIEAIPLTEIEANVPTAQLIVPPTNVQEAIPTVVPLYGSIRSTNNVLLIDT